MSPLQRIFASAARTRPFRFRSKESKKLPPPIGSSAGAGTRAGAPSGKLSSSRPALSASRLDAGEKGPQRYVVLSTTPRRLSASPNVRSLPCRANSPSPPNPWQFGYYLQSNLSPSSCPTSPLRLPIYIDGTKHAPVAYSLVITECRLSDSRISTVMTDLILVVMILATYHSRLDSS